MEEPKEKKISLVGYTGFVGSNILAAAGLAIQGLYHSQNISEAYGTHPDLLIYAGLRAEKYLANSAPEEDMGKVIEAEENIRRISPKKLVLISTIDVFKDPRDVDENSRVETEGLAAYGLNRYRLELWARENFPDSLIIRLPGLFGKNIKKNFIYDFIHRIPAMLSKQKMEELSAKDAGLCDYYCLQENGFYRVKDSSEGERTILKKKFNGLGFSALNFTDSRSRYQFYNLSHLWADMNIAFSAGLKIWHPAAEPVSAGELYRYLTGEEFRNELSGKPADYDYRTAYAGLFGGEGGYISSKEQIMQEIKEFVETTQRNAGEERGKAK